jgi:AraC family transcriptional regulator
MSSPVERAATCIWEHYTEPLSLADIASSALLSRFHFSRVFKDATGVTPGRFLSAVRVFQAKHMLLTTSMTITEITFAVGYNSLGSFISNFTSSVGHSPSQFRRLARNGGFELPLPRYGSAQARGSVAGTITLPHEFQDARVYIAVFETAIMRRRPVSAVIQTATSGRATSYRLPGVPPGTWFVHAVGVADSTDPEPWTRRTSLVARLGGVRVTAGAVTTATLPLRPMQVTDPPVLLALPDLTVPADGTPRPQMPMVAVEAVSWLH